MPEKVGKYKILKRLGAGGMGEVYHAIHEELNREVALKVLRKTAVRDEMVLKRFRSEARAAAMPIHENIVIFYEHGEDSGSHYLAFELVRGTDLQRLIESKGQLPISVSLQFIKQAAKALEHAHKHGFVHRDIKPSNFLISTDKVVKLTDMGLARHLEDLEETKITRDGTTVGTVDYIAPEQAQNSHLADIRSDIYALGCTWYHMLTGEVPYPDGNAIERLYKHASEPVPDVRLKAPKVPPEMAGILNKMMAKEKEDRYQTPTELLEDLETLRLKRPSETPLPSTSANARAGSSGSASPAGAAAPAKATPETQKSGTKPATKKKSKKSNNTVLIAGGAAAVLILAIGAIFIFGGGKTDASSNAVASTANDPPPAPRPRIRALDADEGEWLDMKEDDEANSALPPGESEENDPGKRTDEANPSGEEGTAVALAPGDPGSILDPDGEEGDDEFEDVMAEEVVEDPEAATEPEVPTDAKPHVVLSETDRNRWLGPWADRLAKAPASVDSPVAVRSVANRAKVATNLKAAWNTARASVSASNASVGAIDLTASSPLFATSQSFEGAPLRLTAADPFRPIVVHETSSPNARTWFRLDRLGSAEFDGIHFVLFADDIKNKLLPFALFEAVGTDVTFTRCTFTILGLHNRAMTVLRIPPDAIGADQTGPNWVRFQDCVFQSSNASFLTVEKGDVNVLIDNCCLRSRNRELILMESKGGKSTQSGSLRILSSTLVAGREILRIGDRGQAKFEVATVDSLWSRSTFRQDDDRRMVSIWSSSGDPSGQVSWKGDRVAYLGWASLLAIRSGNRETDRSVANLADWQKLWKNDGAEIVDSERIRWANDSLLATLPRVDMDGWQFPGSSGRTLVGHDVSKFAASLPFWFELAYGVLTPDQFDLGDFKPELATASGQSASIRITSTEQDLTEEIASQPRASHYNVTIATGGRFEFTPITLEDQSLSITAQNTPDQPLVLVPRGSGPAAITIKGGDLRLQGVKVQLTDSGPQALAAIVDGNLFLDRVEITGPLSSSKRTGPMFNITNDTSGGSAETSDWQLMVVQNSAIADAGRLFAFDGPGTIAVVSNSLLVSQADGMVVRFPENPVEGWQGLCIVEHTTVSTGGSAFLIDTAPVTLSRPRLPFQFFVQDSLFTDAIDASGSRARARSGRVMGIAPEAVALGYVTWQGNRNAFDRTRLAQMVGAADSSAKQPFVWEDWIAVWGPRHEVDPFRAKPIGFDGVARSDRFSFESLAVAPGDELQVAGTGGKPIGVDLARLGFEVKPATRTAPLTSTTESRPPLDRSKLTPIRIEDSGASLPGWSRLLSR